MRLNFWVYFRCPRSFISLCQHNTFLCCDYCFQLLKLAHGFRIHPFDKHSRRVVFTDVQSKSYESNLDKMRRGNFFLNLLFLNWLNIYLSQVENLDNQNGVSHDDIGRITRRIHQMAVVECQDANDNTPLSEAGSGGSVQAITYLIQRGLF